MKRAPKIKLPSGGTILAWLGVIGTVLGIVGFFVSDLPGLFGGRGQGLSEEQVIATLAALQEGKQAAELQLTRIALDQLSAANQATQQAVAQQEAAIQGTLAAVRAEQDSFVATRNAIAALTATRAAQDATATAAADVIATATAQAAQDATATANWVAQITPTPTPTPTSAPTPTPTPTPELVSDHRLLAAADVSIGRDGLLVFSVRTAQPIPNLPADGLSYVWSLDTDRSPATGLALQDIGVDVRVAARFENGAWVGTVTTVGPEGPTGDPFLFLDISVSGTNLSATLDPAEVGLPTTFDWVARAELAGAAYSFMPVEGHATLAP
ncbi:MAG: hypothetical protein Kow00124_29100 [Anaerolineae bacterium]